MTSYVLATQLANDDMQIVLFVIINGEKKCLINFVTLPWSWLYVAGRGHNVRDRYNSSDG